MKLSEKQMKFTVMVGKLIAYATELNIGLTMGHAWRDTETQKKLFEQGRSKTMKSKHLDKLAIDLNVFIDKGNGRVWSTKTEDYQTLGEYWKHLGGRWGGDFIGFTDAGHFEYDD